MYVVEKCMLDKAGGKRLCCATIAGVAVAGSAGMLVEDESFMLACREKFSLWFKPSSDSY